jgi:hypothetical protein
MLDFASLSDDHYVNINLGTEMDLPTQRETILHFFERIQKSYPSMRHFSSREKGDFVLEEEKEHGQYRWVSLEARRLCSGQVNPSSFEDALGQHKLVLDLAPFALSVSPLDCEALDLLIGFDFTYRGNHNELVAEALGLPPAFEKLGERQGATIVQFEPTITLALDGDCRLQCRIGIETRTNAYHIRTGEFPDEQLSVFITARRYGSLAPGRTFAESLDELAQVSLEIIQNHLVESVLQPLARTIALK